MLRGEVPESNHTTRKKKIEERLMPEHINLRGKPSRRRKPTVAAKTVLLSTQGSVTHNYIGELYIYI
jgi:hypothetical protein